MTKDKQLLRRARRLEEEALSTIYDRYSDPLYAYAFRHLGDQQTAEDMVAETFERFLTAVQGGGGPEDHLQAYLYRITHNLITDFYRREPPPTLELKEEQLSREGDQPGEIFTAWQEADRLRQALRLLTPEQRQVIMLRFVEGWSTKAVARTLEKSPGAVRGQQHRALASLERILSPDDEKKDS